MIWNEIIRGGDFYPNGQQKIKHCDDGFTEWFENGVIKSKYNKYKDHKYGNEDDHKVSREWYENGQLKYESNDNRDFFEILASFTDEGTKPYSMIEWYDSGRLKQRHRLMLPEGSVQEGSLDDLIKISESWFINGELEYYSESFGGKTIKRQRWHKNGFPEYDNEYDEDGKPTGIHIVRYESWFRKTQSYYKNGTIDGEYFEWHENGELKLLGYYHGGLKQGTFKHWDEDGNLTLEEIFEKDSLVRKKKIRRRGLFGKRSTDNNSEKPYNGQHITFWPNGNKKALSHFRNGKKHGQSKAWFLDGTLEQEGEYKDGMIEGLYTWYFDNGNVRSKQNFHAGKWEGKCKWWYPDDTLKNEATFISGQSHGESIHYFRNGEISAIETYENGTIVKRREWTLERLEHELSEYVDGKLEGCIDTYFIDGSPQSRITMSGGYWSGPWINWYRNGIKWRERNFAPGILNGVLHGISREWYVDGTPKEETSYENGVKHGRCRSWFRDGTLWSDTNFFKGKEDGEYKEWYPNGVLKEERYYQRGKRILEWVKYDEEGQEIDRTFYPDTSPE